MRRGDLWAARGRSKNAPADKKENIKAGLIYENG